MESFISFKKVDIEKLLRLEMEVVKRNMVSNDNFLRLEAMIKFEFIDRLRLEMDLSTVFGMNYAQRQKSRDYIAEMRHTTTIELERYPFVKTEKVEQ